LWLWWVRRRDLGWSLFAAVFPEFIAREKPGQRGTGCQGSKRRVGAARSQRRGLGPVRLDGQALRATVAGESDGLGERRTAADGPGDALKPTPRGERPCVQRARLAGWLLADQVQPVRRHSRGAKQRAAGMGESRSPGGQTQCAGVSRPQGGNDGSPRGARRYSGSMPCTTARPGDAGRRKDHSGRNAKLPKCEASGICRLMSADSPCQRWRTPTAIERSRSDRRRRAPRRNGWARGGLTWPRSAVCLRCRGGIAPPR